MMDNVNNSRKIVLVGLDNAGKTCIARALRGLRDLDDFCDLEPTFGEEIKNTSVGGSAIALWDLGGQVENRRSHIEEFDFKIQNADKIIFVVDIQNKTRYDEAIEYFGEILKLLNNKKCSPEILLLLHKYDYSIMEREEYNKSNLRELIVQPIRKKLPNGIKFTVYKTLISAEFTKIAF